MNQRLDFPAMALPAPWHAAAIALIAQTLAPDISSVFPLVREISILRKDFTLRQSSR